MKRVAEVVAALIWQGTGAERRMMICQRPAHKPCGLLWEFVGGKVEPGESREQALVRECREELAVTVTPGAVFAETLYEYPDLTVHLTLCHAELLRGTPQLLEHCDLRWITPEEIPQYEFCPADADILLKIRLEAAKERIPVGKWRHFKGNEYEVLGIARHSETQEPAVVYRALYGDGALWVRPADMWNEWVEWEGKRQPRFVYEEDRI